MKENVIILLTILLIGVSTYAGCNSINQNENAVTENDTITIRINETYRNDNLNFTLRLDSVLSDSRCPYGAECLWAGNAEVRMKLKLNDNSEYLFKLNTLQSLRQDTVFKGINCKLIELMPYPDIRVIFDYQKYRVKVLVTKE